MQEGQSVPTCKVTNVRLSRLECNMLKNTLVEHLNVYVPNTGQARRWNILYKHMSPQT